MKTTVSHIYYYTFPEYSRIKEGMAQPQTVLPKIATKMWYSRTVEHFTTIKMEEVVSHVYSTLETCRQRISESVLEIENLLSSLPNTADERIRDCQSE